MAGTVAGWLQGARSGPHGRSESQLSRSSAEQVCKPTNRRRPVHQLACIPLFISIHGRQVGRLGLVCRTSGGVALSLSKAGQHAAHAGGRVRHQGRGAAAVRQACAPHKQQLRLSGAPILRGLGAFQFSKPAKLQVRLTYLARVQLLLNALVLLQVLLVPAQRGLKEGAANVRASGCNCETAIDLCNHLQLLLVPA